MGALDHAYARQTGRPAFSAFRFAGRVLRRPQGIEDPDPGGGGSFVIAAIARDDPVEALTEQRRQFGRSFPGEVSLAGVWDGCAQPFGILDRHQTKRALRCCVMATGSRVAAWVTAFRSRSSSTVVNSRIWRLSFLRLETYDFFDYFANFKVVQSLFVLLV